MEDKSATLSVLVDEELVNHLCIFIVTNEKSRGQARYRSPHLRHWTFTAQRKTWDEMLDKQSDLARSKDRIHPQAVARAASDLAARDAVFVIDTGLNTLWSGNWIRQSGEQRIIGSFNNGAVGTALGQAMVSRRSTVRARLSRSAATAVSIC